MDPRYTNSSMYSTVARYYRHSVYLHNPSFFGGSLSAQTKPAYISHRYNNAKKVCSAPNWKDGWKKHHHCTLSARSAGYSEFCGNWIWIALEKPLGTTSSSHSVWTRSSTRTKAFLRTKENNGVTTHFPSSSSQWLLKGISWWASLKVHLWLAISSSS